MPLHRAYYDDDVFDDDRPKRRRRRRRPTDNECSGRFRPPEFIFVVRYHLDHEHGDRLLNSVKGGEGGGSSGSECRGEEGSSSNGLAEEGRSVSADYFSNCRAIAAALQQQNSTQQLQQNDHNEADAADDIEVGSSSSSSSSYQGSDPSNFTQDDTEASGDNDDTNAPSNSANINRQPQQSNDTATLDFNKLNRPTKKSQQSQRQQMKQIQRHRMGTMVSICSVLPPIMEESDNDVDTSYSSRMSHDDLGLSFTAATECGVKSEWNINHVLLNKRAAVEASCEGMQMQIAADKGDDYIGEVDAYELLDKVNSDKQIEGGEVKEERAPLSNEQEFCRTQQIQLDDADLSQSTPQLKQSTYQLPQSVSHLTSSTSQLQQPTSQSPLPTSQLHQSMSFSAESTSHLPQSTSESPKSTSHMPQSTSESSQLQSKPSPPHAKDRDQITKPSSQNPKPSRYRRRSSADYIRPEKPKQTKALSKSLTNVHVSTSPPSRHNKSMSHAEKGFMEALRIVDSQNKSKSLKSLKSTNDVLLGDQSRPKSRSKQRLKHDNTSTESQSQVDICKLRSTRRRSKKQNHNDSAEGPPVTSSPLSVNQQLELKKSTQKLSNIKSQPELSFPKPCSKRQSKKSSHANTESISKDNDRDAGDGDQSTATPSTKSESTRSRSKRQNNIRNRRNRSKDKPSKPELIQSRSKRHSKVKHHDDPVEREDQSRHHSSQQPKPNLNDFNQSDMAVIDQQTSSCTNTIPPSMTELLKALPSTTHQNSNQPDPADINEAIDILSSAIELLKAQELKSRPSQEEETSRHDTKANPHDEPQGKELTAQQKSTDPPTHNSSSSSSIAIPPSENSSSPSITLPPSETSNDDVEMRKEIIGESLSFMPWKNSHDDDDDDESGSDLEVICWEHTEDDVDVVEDECVVGKESDGGSVGSERNGVDMNKVLIQSADPPGEKSSSDGSDLEASYRKPEDYTDQTECYFEHQSCSDAGSSGVEQSDLQSKSSGSEIDENVDDNRSVSSDDDSESGSSSEGSSNSDKSGDNEEPSYDCTQNEVKTSKKSSQGLLQLVRQKGPKIPTKQKAAIMTKFRSMKSMAMHQQSAKNESATASAMIDDDTYEADEDGVMAFEDSVLKKKAKDRNHDNGAQIHPFEDGYIRPAKNHDIDVRASDLKRNPLVSEEMKNQVRSLNDDVDNTDEQKPSAISMESHKAPSFSTRPAATRRSTLSSASTSSIPSRHNNNLFSSLPGLNALNTNDRGELLTWDDLEDAIYIGLHNSIADINEEVNLNQEWKPHVEHMNMGQSVYNPSSEVRADASTGPMTRCNPSQSGNGAPTIQSNDSNCEKEPWRCSKCTFINDNPLYLTCGVCNLPRDD